MKSSVSTYSTLVLRSIAPMVPATRRLIREVTLSKRPGRPFACFFKYSIKFFVASLLLSSFLAFFISSITSPGSFCPRLSRSSSVSAKDLCWATASVSLSFCSSVSASSLILPVARTPFSATKESLSAAKPCRIAKALGSVLLLSSTAFRYASLWGLDRLTQEGNSTPRPRLSASRLIS